MGAQAWYLRGYRPLALLALAMAVATLWALVVVLSGADPTATRTNGGSLTEGLSHALTSSYQQEVTSEYHIAPLTSTSGEAHDLAADVSTLPGLYRASNPVHGLVTSFNRSGIWVTPQVDDADWNLAMRLAAYGYGDGVLALPEPEFWADGNRVEYRYAPEGLGSGVFLTEWYLNGPPGLEQGFTLNAPPAGAGTGLPSRLRLDLAVGGNLTPRLREDGHIAFANLNGALVLSYSGLYAYDSTGRELPAELALREGGFSILVDDSDAVYPITIDPFIRKAKLTASDGAGGDRFGRRVGIDGSTAVIGAHTANSPGMSDSGKAYVFERIGGGWSERQVLEAINKGPGDRFGRSVGISGNTLAVGADREDTKAGNAGAVYVFVRSGNAWVEQAILTVNVPDAGGGDRLGDSVAIDGDTVVAGTPFDDDLGSQSGSAFVFVRSGDTWSQQAKLHALDGQASDDFGEAVAISEDTVVVGATDGDQPG